MAYLFNEKEYIIAFRPTEPTAILYDKNFNKIKDLVIPNYGLFKNTIDDSEGIYKTGANTLVYLYGTVYNQNGNYYLPVYETSSLDKSVSLNKVLVIEFDYKKQELNLNEVVHLNNEGWYQYLIINDENNLIAFDEFTYSLHHFKY